MKRYCLILAACLAVCVRGELIKLADGRVVDGRVLSETDETITVVVGKTAQKISKNLLHAESLARYPIKTPPPPEPLSPEPSGLEKPRPGARDITRENGGTFERWSLWVDTRSGPKLVLAGSRGTSLLESKTRYIMVVRPADYGITFDLMAKALEWKDAASAAKAPDFDKALGVIGEDEWKFSWSYSRASVSTRDAILYEDDLQHLTTLMLAAPHVMNETGEQHEKAKQFADSLK